MNPSFIAKVLSLLKRIIFPWDYLILIYFALSIILQFVSGINIDYSLILNLQYEYEYLLYFALFFGFAVFYKVFIHHSGTIVWHHVLRRFYEVLNIIVCIRICLVIHCNIKQAIPQINTLLFDQHLLFADIFFHGGLNPSEIFTSLINSTPLPSI